MNEIVEVMHVTKISGSKVWLPKKVRERFSLKDGEPLAICLNKSGDLVIKKAISTSTTSDMFSY